MSARSHPPIGGRLRTAVSQLIIYLLFRGPNVYHDGGAPPPSQLAQGCRSLMPRTKTLGMAAGAGPLARKCADAQIQQCTPQRIPTLVHPCIRGHPCIVHLHPACRRISSATLATWTI